jgi:O-antigen/teichoic acid export membrane protein
MVSQLIVQAAISRQLGAAQLGLYFIALRLASLPSEVLGEVVGAVAFALCARLQSDVSQATIVFRILLVGSTALLYPVLALTIALAPSVAHELLGSVWTETSAVIRILALAAMLGLVGDVAIPLYKGLGRPQLVTALEAVQSLMLMILVWPFVARYGVLGAALTWLPAVLGSQLLNLWLLHILLRRPLRTLGWPLMAIGTVSVGGAGIALALVHVVPGMLGLVVAAASAIVATGAVILALDRPLGLGLASILTQAFPGMTAVLGARRRESSS